MTWVISGVYAALMLAKLVLAWRQARRAACIPTNTDPLTVIQPILSGDPLLEATLAANAAGHPDIRFLWLIDEGDVEGLRIGRLLEQRHPHVHVVLSPAPRDGENPKLAKLIQALPLVTTPRLLVLDDDTRWPPDTPLPTGALVTGLPVFCSRSSIYERLIGGFVNGNAVLTYLPAAALGLQRTINGMFYAVDAAQLRALGGFAAVGHELTDDYAVARLYLRNSLSITQSITPAEVAMTVATASHYARVMRRWMIFANRYFSDNKSLKAAFWIGLPGLLPLAGLVAAIAEHRGWLWIVVLLGKSIANHIMLSRLALGPPATPADLLFELVADLTTPVWAAVALARPHRLTWRSRRIDATGGMIRYR